MKCFVTGVLSISRNLLYIEIWGWSCTEIYHIGININVLAENIITQSSWKEGRLELFEIFYIQQRNVWHAWDWLIFGKTNFIGIIHNWKWHKN